MNPNAETAFLPEIDGFNLVAMAEGHPSAPEDPAQAAMTAGPGAEAFAAENPAGGLGVSAESAENPYTNFDQLDARRKSAVSACGSGACAGCVQKCGAYNPEDSGEEFNLVEKATGVAKSGNDDSGFRSRIRFSAEEAQQRMAERRASKAKEADAVAADRPTPQQRDQIIEIRRTAADPESVRDNLVRGHARMAERQKEREDRMAEQAKQEADRNNLELNGKKTSVVDSGVQKIKAEQDDPVLAESDDPKQAAGPIKAQTPRPKIEATETTATVDTKEPREPALVEVSQNQPDDVEAQHHAEEVHIQTSLAQDTESSDEPMAQPASADLEHAQADQDDGGGDTDVHEQQIIQDEQVLQHEETDSSEEAQIPSTTHFAIDEEPAQLEAKPDDAEASHSEFIDETEHSTIAEHEQGSIQDELIEVEAESADILIVRADANLKIDDAISLIDESEFAENDSEPVSTAADPEALHEFSLEYPEIDIEDTAEVTSEADQTVSDVHDDHINVEAPVDIDAYEAGSEADETDEDLSAPVQHTYDDTDEAPDLANVSTLIEDEPSVAVAPAVQDTEKIDLAEFESSERELTDELDEAGTDNELVPENLDYAIMNNQESTEYSRGSAKEEDGWKSNSKHHSKKNRKSAQQIFRRVQSSTTIVSNSKRNRKKLLKLLTTLGQFVTDNFNKSQLEVNEGAEA